MSFYRQLKPLLFKIDPEKAHNLVTKLMSITPKLHLLESYLVASYCKVYDNLSQDIHGLHFYNPVGLASGFDKNAEFIRSLAGIGFGFLELGSITQMPQNGNPKPRIFRHIEEESMQNAMGFNNIGARGMLANLKKHYPFSIPLGINIGKNKDLVLSDSLKNYELSLDTLKDHGDYFTFNLSSPNTPNLRDLQNESFVGELISMAREVTNKPLFLKISPDMEVDVMLAVCQKAIDCGINGIVATNTTIDYNVIANPIKKNDVAIGGISGKALCEKSRTVLKILGQNFFGKTTLISLGGISDANELYTRLGLGASLVQLMTSFIFHGPSLIANINKELSHKLEVDGFKSISEMIGKDISQ
ncbi:dihydroorotate dehydrogenase (quinone) [Helicobacter muridarum]|uniref:Dihydroorotate dehydrogenase (quinone) n=1 Tax=Helicobacter muridarum TaxID=216 RepID=A0A099U1V2_9HELI|nr:dihydroorotate dehydrogenase (quinone) [Helicobacter muridarum]TLE00339.1 dihydroorotate dehydrogenase (quinone) [Helicobacter muridarum]STQ85842.1 dihydroorotate dehydrogenase [Helicobacter muridarum]